MVIGLSLYYLGLFVMPVMAIALGVATVHTFLKGELIAQRQGRRSVVRLKDEPFVFLTRVAGYAAASLFALCFFLVALIKGSDGFI